MSVSLSQMKINVRGGKYQAWVGIIPCVAGIAFAVTGCAVSPGQQRANGRDEIEPRTMKEAVGNYDAPPHLESGQTPLYPPVELQDRVVGKASVSYTIGIDGRAGDIKIIQASEKDFGIALSEAVGGWTFTPATRAGLPVSTSVSMTYRFCLPPPYDDCKAL